MSVATMSGRGEPETLMDVNTTPLIDVMLVLLVMLILTIPTQFHAINLDIGQGGKQLHQPVVHTVSIDFDGAVYWDGQALHSQAAVDAKMQEVGALAAADQPEVHIKPNRLVYYSAVAAVMASAQRHSVKKMGIAGDEQFAS